MGKISHSMRNVSIFVIPSLLGACSFLLPFKFYGEVNTLLGHAKELILNAMGNHTGDLVLFVSLAVTALSVTATSVRPEWIMRSRPLRENIICSPFWLAFRFLSVPLVMAALWGDPAQLGNFLKDVQLIVLNLAPKLIVLTVILSLTAPMLLDFGLVQFVAVYASPVMRPLFRVPGRSAVDCIASWLGSSSMAVVITAKMHLSGYYNDREATVMITNFSLTGIYNIYAVTTLLNLRYAFPKIIFSVYLTTFILAVIMPRIWPLNKIPEKYHGGIDNFSLQEHEERYGHSIFEWAVLRGINKARHMNIKAYFNESFSIALPLLFGTIPLMITFGTIFLSIADMSRILAYISAPISYLLTLSGIPEAKMLGGTVIFAFIDQYLAVAYGQTLSTETARFLCICLTTVGLINITEVGLHVWHSTIPISFSQMLLVYLMRIVISMFFLVPLCYIFFP